MTTSEELLQEVTRELGQHCPPSMVSKLFPKVHKLMQAYRQSVADSLRLEKTIHHLTK
jgi:hypothetical protein